MAVVSDNTIIVRAKFIEGGIRDFGRALAMTNENLKKNIGQTNRTVSAGGKLGMRFKTMFTGLHGFRMEMLSVMFFGMAMQRFFKGLLQPALELAGVFNVIRDTLAIFFLPTALMILNWVLKLQNFLLSLSPTIQKWVGVLVLAAFALGSVLFFIGMFTLGIGGLLTAFGGLAAAIIGFIASPIALLIAALVGSAGVSAAMLLVGADFSSVGRLIKKVLEGLGVDTEQFGQFWNDIKEKWVGPALEKIKALLREWFKEFKADNPELIEELGKWKLAFENISLAVKDLINFMVRLGNKMVEFVGSPNFRAFFKALGLTGRIVSLPIRAIGGAGFQFGQRLGNLQNVIEGRSTVGGREANFPITNTIIPIINIFTRDPDTTVSFEVTDDVIAGTERISTTTSVVD